MHADTERQLRQTTNLLERQKLAELAEIPGHRRIEFRYERRAKYLVGCFKRHFPEATAPEVEVGCPTLGVVVYRVDFIGLTPEQNRWIEGFLEGVDIPS